MDTDAKKPEIIQFERVGNGILIPVGQEKSWWRDHLAKEDKCPEFEGSGLCNNFNFHAQHSCLKKNERCRWNGYGNKG